MNPERYKNLTLASLKWRSGLDLLRGEDVEYTSYYLGGMSIHQRGKKSEGAFHRAQEAYSKHYFASHGFSVFPEHIGVRGIARWADFAVARYRRVILVECATDWFPDTTIPNKLEIAAVAEVWFITQEWGRDFLKKRGYIISVLPMPDEAYEYSVDGSFWICRPRSSKDICA